MKCSAEVNSVCAILRRLRRLRIHAHSVRGPEGPYAALGCCLGGRPSGGFLACIFFINTGQTKDTPKRVFHFGDRQRKVTSRLFVFLLTNPPFFDMMYPGTPPETKLSRTAAAAEGWMTMRGIETRIQEIRHRIFREVARMAYHTEWPVDKRIEELPYKIIPGEVGNYRNDVFLERAIVGERLRLAMGLPCRSAAEHAPLSDNIEAADQAETSTLR